MTAVGTAEHPLRVAIIGSGPSAFYAADALLKSARVVQIDMFERLPTPHGLVRGGVAPDHQKIKSVTKVYDKIAASPHFRFFGNVEYGRDVTHDDLIARYHQIVYATGAQTDRRMGISGEDLPGSHAATEFVAWYNAHPDYQDRHFDLNTTRAIVIGNGNVAMDVARILASTPAELAKTDISDTALAALRESCVREVVVIGRRGAAQAAFSNPEIKELGELEETQVIVPPNEADLDPLSAADLAASGDRMAANNAATLARYAAALDSGKPRRIVMRFLWSPIAIMGTDRVEGVRLVRNELMRADDGSLRAHATDHTIDVPAGLIFRSIGYKGVALPGVPFDERAGVIPNQAGRVVMSGMSAPVLGEYVTGWIKRGPSGVIGTNKADSAETATAMLADMDAGALLTPTLPAGEAWAQTLRARGVRIVTYADWMRLDAEEVARGQASARPRVKFDAVAAMLAFLGG